MREIVSSRPFRRFRRPAALAVAIGLFSMIVTADAAASDQVYFSSSTDVTSILVQYINQETVRLDISSWYLSEHAISIAIANRWAAGVPVRIIGDRAALFENDPHTKAEFYWLANQGIPIRLRFNPTWFPEIDHWKAAIFVGQNMVEFGSGNFAPTELAPVSSTNYDDDSELFTTDPTLYQAFLTKFDVMWNDTTVEPDSIISGPPYLMNWNDACANEPTGNCADYPTLYPNPAPMIINTARLEPDYPMPADFYWGQGTDFNNRLTQEINNETSQVDLVIYRLEVQNITQALLNRFQAGVNVRVIVDPAQYTDNAWPEYWLTHANVDLLYAAGVPMLMRTHQGVTHMKTLITSNYATNASSNFAANWQRDHDYFVSAATKPGIYQAFVNDFQSMWTDTTNFAPFTPTPPLAATQSIPASGATDVPTNVTFVWSAASYATSYDIYLGTTSANMVRVANVAAQLVQNPPTTYSWTPPTPLQPGQNYDWMVVSRTFATPVNSAMTANSSIEAFMTASTATPTSPTPTSGATGVGTSPTLSWGGSGTANTTYTVSFGTTNPPPQVATGLVASSYQPGALSAATTYFWSVTAVSSSGSVAGPVWSFSTDASAGASLPSPWQNQDVGSTGLAGSTTNSGGTFTVSGSGADIWGTADAFQYVYQPFSGNAQIVARVTSLTNTNTEAKAGVMLRQSLDPGAADVILDVRPDGSLEFMSRATGGGSTAYIAGGTQMPPTWLMLALAGSTVTGSVSPDGVNWTSVGTTGLTLSGSGVIGLAVTSHDTTQLNTATIDNIAVTGGSGGGGGTTPAPAAPASPTPAAGATGVSTGAGLAWTATGATSYDVSFGTATPPPTVSAGQAAATYQPATLNAGTTYYWQIVAHNSAGTSTGPVWSFTTQTSSTGSTPPANVVIYASDVPASAIFGLWSATSDATSPNGIKLATPANGTANTASALVAPNDYVDVTFTAAANTPYTLWLRVEAANNSKSSDSLWVQFSDASVNGSAVYPIGTTSGLLVNLATDSTAVSDQQWGWVNGAYWLQQPATVTFATTGSHTLRIQPREYGVEFDQIVLSPSTYLNPSASCPLTCGSAPGPVSNDQTIVPKPTPPVPPGTPASPSPADSATGVSATPVLTWSASGGTSFDVSFGTTNPPPMVTTGQASASYAPSSLAAGTSYFWQVVAHNAAGATTGPVWSFTTTAAASAPSAPATPTPATGVMNVSTSPTLTWNATGATSYDIAFGTTNPPPTVIIGQASASYAPSPLAAGTSYFWQVVAHNAAGATTGPVWSFTTAAASAPSAPGTPTPATGDMNVSTSPTLTWNATGATSYNIAFGTTNPPPTVSTGLTSASYAPTGLTNATTYYWQIVANDSTGSTSGPVWSFSTATASGNIVIYASDIPSSAVHGLWSATSDPTSPNGTKLATPANGSSSDSAPVAAPSDYVDVTFDAAAGIPYTFWIRIEATNNSKYSDSMWVQFSDALANGAAAYPIDTTSGLDVNLATDTTASSDVNWGWVDGAYWLAQPATVTFAATGSHTLRIQPREYGVEFDQIVLSPNTYLNPSASCPLTCGSAPGTFTNDQTIVPKQ